MTCFVAIRAPHIQCALTVLTPQPKRLGPSHCACQMTHEFLLLCNKPWLPLPNLVSPNPRRVQTVLELEIDLVLSTFFTVSIADIDGHITRTLNALSLFPRSDRSHADCIDVLSKARFLRFKRLEQKEDLDKSILHITEANFLPTFLNIGPSYHIVKLLSFLAQALLQRSRVFDQPEDLKYSIQYLQHLHKLPLESFGMPMKVVTIRLTQALADQVRMEAGHGTQNIAEIVVLCRELLPISADSYFPDEAFISLKQALDAESNRGQHIQLLDEVIECLRDAEKLYPPGSYGLPFFFGQPALHSRHGNALKWRLR